jgi:Mlc titration factor MtfA (ptsG expression regulator)
MQWPNWLRRRLGIPSASDIPEQAWQHALAQLPWAQALEEPTRARLREFSARFINDKAITAAGGMTLDDEQNLLIAMLCCRPVLNMDYGWLRGWHEVVVYPRPFRSSLRSQDPDTGVVFEREANTAGQSFRRGPLVLNWADLRANIDRPEPGFDLAVHEIAHKLDGLHDGVDGAPRLHVDERQGWARDFQAAFDALRADLEAGREPPINPYAASAHAEFFAVCSEYWFTAPALLQAAYPAVARRLSDFYGRAPA